MLFGSCICNLLLVIGITSVIRPVKVENRIIKRHIPIGLAAMVFLLFISNLYSDGVNSIIYRWQGILLLLFALWYIMYTIYEERKMKDKQYDEEIIEEVKTKESKAKSIITNLAYFILGILGLRFGSEFVVDNAVIIAEKLGLSEQFIGITIISIGTSLPEIITGITVARKGNTDIILGNIIGSNILNLCLLVGIGSIISPIIYEVSFNSSVLFLIAMTMFIQLLMNKDNQVSRKNGIVLIIIYIFYIIFVAK